MKFQLSSKLIGFVLVVGLCTASAEEHGTKHEDKPEVHAKKSIKQVEPTETDSEEAPEVQKCLVDPMTIEDIQKRKEELEKREKELSAKEKELKAAQVAFDGEFKKIKQVRDEIEKYQGLNKKENEEKIAKLVETFETMGPKPAAKLLESIDESLAVSAMTRMSTLKLAKILSAMESESSSRLTELMAGVIKIKKMKPVTESHEKGGEENGNTNRSASSYLDNKSVRPIESEQKAEKSI